MKKTIITLGVIAVLVIIFLAMGPFFVVEEGTQVVVTRFGQFITSHEDAGLHFKVPFIDEVIVYPKLILSLDGDPEPIPTKEKQYIVVDTTARWRISDPRLFYQSFKTLDTGYNRLSDIIDSATRMIVGQNTLNEVVRSSNLIITNHAVPSDGETDSQEIRELEATSTTPENVQKGRRQLSLEMAEEARKGITDYGIELIDIVPRQIKYSDEMTESVYSRMIKDRNQIAQFYRSQGEAEKAKWLGKVENEKRAILSEAYKTAEEVKGAADAEATRIYAEAYAKDPEFYAFWKSLESYKETLPKFDTTYSTDMQYFKYLYSSEGR
ncbi:MAG: protease modulator HflC [Spirochaetaceae bacterium]|nr:protease modulator HflC [Spirochaetaceae bacterium]MBR3813194.1 protease modulator HflC [Spirochaetaceae bacterium]